MPRLLHLLNLQIIAPIRGLQALIFIPSVIVGAQWYGINGVAIAANIMIVIGAVLLFRNTYRVVDYSAEALWLWPITAMILITTVSLSLNSWFSTIPDIWALSIKITFIPTLFLGILLMTEREQLQIGWNMIRGLIRPQRKMTENKNNSNNG